MAKIRGRITGWLCAAVAAMAASAPVHAGSDDLTTTAVKRYFLAQADARCHLLSTPVATAIKAGYLQARNALIRASGSMNTLNGYLGQARDAADHIACDAPQLADQVSAANSAYPAYAAQFHLVLPSGRTQWLGNRAFGDTAAWRLAQYQSNNAGDLALGLYGSLGDSHFVVMANFRDGQPPYSARLMLRDPDLSANGLINRAPYELSDTAPLLFADAASTFVASGHSQVQVNLRPPVTANEAGFALSGDYVGRQETVSAVRFDFPTRAYRLIALLDPREDMVVAFDFPDGTRYARFEVGDFMTGLGYISLPSAFGKTS